MRFDIEGGLLVGTLWDQYIELRGVRYSAQDGIIEISGPTRLGNGPYHDQGNRHGQIGGLVVGDLVGDVRAGNTVGFGGEGRQDELLTLGRKGDAGPNRSRHHIHVRGTDKEVILGWDRDRPKSSQFGMKNNGSGGVSGAREGFSGRVQSLYRDPGGGGDPVLDRDRNGRVGQRRDIRADRVALDAPIVGGG